MTYFPVSRPDLHSMAEELKERHWVFSEFDYSDSLLEVSESDRKKLAYVFSFFSKADDLVIDNLISAFYNEINIDEAKYFYALQIENEKHHELTYKKIIREIFPNSEEILSETETVPQIMALFAWFRRFAMKESGTLAQRLFAYSVAEGILFVSKFTCIYDLCAKYPKLKTIDKSNEFISQDEDLHARFALRLITYIDPEFFVNERDFIRDVIAEAVQIELDFVNLVYPVGESAGVFSNDSVSRYVKYRANEHCRGLLNITMYPEAIENPIARMDLLYVRKKTDFFSNLSADYVTKKISVDYSAASDDF